jgi:hypothetical protein
MSVVQGTHQVESLKASTTSWELNIDVVNQALFIRVISNVGPIGEVP